MSTVRPSGDRQNETELKEYVRDHYAGAVQAALQTFRSEAKEGSECCAPGCCGETTGMDLLKGAYSPEELALIPEEAVAASFGCGNPTALADLHPGEVVLDLGSGSGIDVLLSARRVGPEGKVYGLDMTDEMLELARENQRKSGLTNVEFLKGDIEQIPLPDRHVDVIISNCVINLAADKDRVLSEAYRVLRPGGRFAVSDIVILGDRSHIPPEFLERAELWATCVAGALTEGEYLERLRKAGFENASVEVTQVYGKEILPEELASSDLLGDSVKLASAFVRARKPL